MFMRVYEVAKAAGATSKRARQVLASIGHTTKSASSKIDLLPTEREAVIDQVALFHRLETEREARKVREVEREAERAAMESRRSERNHKALRVMESMGVTISGFAVAPEPNSCDGCTWHLDNEVEGLHDGGEPYALLGWLEDGYLGAPRNCVLSPVAR